MPTRGLLAALCGVALGGLPAAEAAAAFQHGWGRVADVMAMHAKYKPDVVPSEEDIAFVARNYGMVTVGTGCGKTVTASSTMEDSVLSVARRIKAVNPAVKVGMYWRADFASELAQCSDFSDEWNSHPEWILRDDSGKDLSKAYIDHSNPQAADFFTRVLVNVTLAQLPSGEPIVDYIYIDGGTPGVSRATSYQPGIGPERSSVLFAASYANCGDIQRRMDALGGGRGVILNGMDDDLVAGRQVATGGAGMMFDHWSILQFLDKTGDFQKEQMTEAFDLMTSELLSNVTVHVKGWPGPIVQQKDKYPPSLPTPKTPAEFQRVAGERFNSELALFLLVASAKDFWLYSWFWGWDDWVPGAPASSVPQGFFPEAQCQLGAPTGPMQRVAGTWTFERHFEHASVFVDLTSRSASRVDFQGCRVAAVAAAAVAAGHPGADRSDLIV